MKRLQLPKNKLARLVINVLLIAAWFVVFVFISQQLIFNVTWTSFLKLIEIGGVYVVPILFLLIPSFFITRYIWTGRIKPRARITSSKDD